MPAKSAKEEFYFFILLYNFKTFNFITFCVRRLVLHSLSVGGSFWRRRITFPAHSYTPTRKYAKW